jgi:hypothetical protein
MFHPGTLPKMKPLNSDSQTSSYQHNMTAKGAAQKVVACNIIRNKTPRHQHLSNYYLCFKRTQVFLQYMNICDCLCGLVVRIPGYRSRWPGFDSQCYQIFWEIVGLERGPLSLVSTIEELLGRNSSGSGLENREYGHWDPLRLPRDILYLQKLAPTSLTCGGHSVGIVRFRAKTTELVLYEHLSVGLLWGFVHCKVMSV